METVQKISHLEHILKRPDSYVGPTARTTEQYWVLEESKFVQKNLTFSPALLKIFDEILVNAIDRNSTFPKLVKSIAITVDKESGSISVENNGPLGGISVIKNEKEGIWNPELTFGHLLTSTNYDDTQSRVVGGRNGYGAKLANIYSSLFKIEVQDSENKVKYSQTWTNNMSKVEEPVMKKYSLATSSVKITFVPDWKRFGMKSLDEDFFKIVEKRVYDAVVCTSSNCKVSFQGERLEQMSTEDYAKMYLAEGTPVATLNSERWSVTVAPSDGFQQVSFVNGICTTKGGTHIDHVVSCVTSGIIDELASKKLQLKPQNIKGTLFVMVRSTLVNPTFGSQVKSECTLKTAEFGSRFESTQKFIKSVLKTGIQDEILAVAKFKELKELKKTDGSRKSKITGIPKLDDANHAGTSRSERCVLIVTEGDSAKTLAVAGLSVVGRDYYGVFPLRGKCKNVRDASVKQLMANQEFNDLKKILGLQQDREYKSLSELRYGKLMIMTDADNDGSHIKGLILNMIHYFWPSLLTLNFVVSMVTPIIKATKGSQSESFYTDSAFQKWYKNECETLGHTWKIKYYKGLGTSTSAEAREYFKSITKLTVAFEVDETAKDSIILAFDKTKADERKQWLLENSGKSLEVGYGDISRLQVSDFVHKDLINFSLADLRRSVANMCDGLKPSQRKVLYACFERGLREEMKVAQLAAYVSEKTSYHHGEVSLAETIVKLAHDFVGSNNVNLLEPCGQFGTRLMGGKDASQTRYIFTKLTPDARRFFDPKDDPVLEYLTDDGKQIEPEFFVPVLPTVLVNGTEGIGTGFSCFVPPYSPGEIIDNVSRCIEGKDPVKMTPWFKGFKGTIAQDPGDEHAWIMRGVYTVNGSTVTVTELPPGRWTQDYKEHLDDLCEKKVITGYKNNSTTNDVHFEIEYEGTNLEKDLKIVKTLRTSNMHLFHPDTGIKKYSSAEEILVDFVELRIRYYNLRKKHMIKSLTEKALVLSNKAKFVRQVVDGDLVIFKRKKSSLEDELVRKFGASDYLLDIKTYQYTEEAIVKLNKESLAATEELEKLKQTKILDLWKTDIKNMIQ
jgi:DNA topoisomerase-2